VDPGRYPAARRILLGEEMYMPPYTLSESVYLRCMIWMRMDYNLSSVAGCQGMRSHLSTTGHTGQIVVHIHPQHRYCLTSF
jgi:hypothetical protein